MSRKKEVEEKIDFLESDQYNDNLVRIQWANIDSRICAGDPTLFGCVFQGLDEKARKVIYSNHIKPKVNTLANAISRYERAYRVDPKETRYDRFASQLTKALFWFTDTTKRYKTMRHCFRYGSVIPGLGAIRFQRTFSEDIICGDPYLKFVPYNCFHIDSKCENADLSDCRIFSFRNCYTKQAIENMLGDNIQYDTSFKGKDNNELCRMKEVYYRDFREAEILYDEITEYQQELLDKDKDQRSMLRKANPNIRSVKVKIATVRLAIYVDDELVWDGMNELGIDRYPIALMAGDWDPTVDLQYRYQGLVRTLIPPQFMRSSIQTDQFINIKDQTNPPVQYDMGAVHDVNDVYQLFHRKRLPMKPGTAMDSVRIMETPQVNASGVLFSNGALQEMDVISGINPAASGTDTGDVPGITNRGREYFSFHNYNHYYDNYNQANLSLGEIFIEFIRKNYSVAKLTKILGEPPVNEFFNGIRGSYNILLKKGNDTETQQQMQLSDMEHLSRVFGIQFPTEIILEESDLVNKDKVMAILKQQEQQAAQAQQLGQMQDMESKRAENKLLEANAVAQMGSALERATKATENRANIENEQVESTTRLIKAIKDIDSIELDNLNKYLQTIGVVKNNLMPTPTQDEEAVVVAQMGENTNENQDMRQ